MPRVRAFGSLVALSAAIAVAGCHKKVVQTVPPPPPPVASTAPTPPPPPPPPPAPAPRAAPAAAAPTEEEIFARKSLEQLNSEHPVEDVFFDLDKSEIRSEGRATLQKGSDWLKRWTSTRITVEGHCDSRGSSEYNLALGSRRAMAVKDYLVNLGVPDSRIAVVSKGKEQPFCSEENEGCWQQNRRGHFLITAK